MQAELNHHDVGHSQESVTSHDVGQKRDKRRLSLDMEARGILVAECVIVIVRGGMVSHLRPGVVG